MYGGQQVIRPDQLKELDTAEIVVPYGADGAGEPEQKYRDVMKSLTAMQDENTAYLLLGIENQSDVHYAMPVKNLVYDAIHYAKQVQEAANSHRKAKDYKEHDKGEFLSGFYKEDKLIPVITLVIFFSPDGWNGPTSLHEMMNVTDERILSLVPDYQIHLIAPAGLTDEELKKFHSSLREVLGFIKYANDMETMDMCKAWEDMKVKAAKEAAKEMQEETLLQNLNSLMRTLHLSAEQAMAALEVPEAKSSKLVGKL